MYDTAYIVHLVSGFGVFCAMPVTYTFMLLTVAPCFNLCYTEESFLKLVINQYLTFSKFTSVICERVI